MNKKKIMLFMVPMLENGGGFENSLMDIAHDLATIETADITVVTMDEGFNSRLARILTFYYFRNLKNTPLNREKTDLVQKRLGNAKYYKCTSLADLKDKLMQADVVYSKNEILESFVLKLFVGKRNIKRLVYNCGTTFIFPYAISFHAKLHNFLYQSFLYKFLANIADHYIVKNSFELDKYKSFFNTQNVTLIPNSFDFNNPKFSNNNVYRLKGDNNTFKILWIGRLTREKGINDFVELIHQANNDSEFPRSTWHILGQGEEYKAIEDLVSIHKNVYYYGHIPNEEIISLYRAADVFLSTSLGESFGITIIESIASNTPVVTRNIPGPSDIVIEGLNGYFANNVDEFLVKLKMTFNNKDKLQDIKDSIAHFGDSNIQKRYETLLGEV